MHLLVLHVGAHVSAHAGESVTKGTYERLDLGKLEVFRGNDVEEGLEVGHDDVEARVVPVDVLALARGAVLKERVDRLEERAPVARRRAADFFAHGVARWQE